MAIEMTRDQIRKRRYMDKPDWNEITGESHERLTRADCFYVLTYLLDAEGYERDALMEWYYALLGSGVLQDWEAADFGTRSKLHKLARWGTEEGFKAGGASTCN